MKIKLTIIILLLCTILSGCNSSEISELTKLNNDYLSQIEELQNVNLQLLDTNNNIKADNDELKIQFNNISGQLVALEEEFNKLQEVKNELNNSIDSMMIGMSDAGHYISDLEAQLELLDSEIRIELISGDDINELVKRAASIGSRLNVSMPIDYEKSTIIDDIIWYKVMVPEWSTAKSMRDDILAIYTNEIAFNSLRIDKDFKEIDGELYTFHNTKISSLRSFGEELPYIVELDLKTGELLCRIKAYSDDSYEYLDITLEYVAEMGYRINTLLF